MFRTLLAVVLSVVLAAPLSATRFIAPKARLSAAPGTLPALNPQILLRSLELHLHETDVRLGSSLPDLSAAEYLSRQALGADAEAAVESAVAARVVGAVLADPAVRRGAVARLRRMAGEDGARIAQKLEDVGRAADGLKGLEALGRDMRAGVDAGGLLPGLFDGAADAAALTTPEAFVSYASRRFGAGRLRAPVIAAVPGDDALRGSVELSPLTNAEREAVVYDLFRRAGAREDEIQMQDIGRGSNNIFVVKKGRTDRVVVVGGHHDKVHKGHGTIDNWTGATMVVNLYQAMREFDTEATYIFMTFGREEEGLVGSREYVGSLSRSQIGKIDAMINLDTLGVDGTFSWRNKSDRVILEMFDKMAREHSLDLKETTLYGGDSDQTSFRRVGIPGGMLYGASEHVIWDIIHSENDTFIHFSLPHYKNAFLVALATLRHLDGNSARRRVSRWLAGWTARFISWLS